MQYREKVVELREQVQQEVVVPQMQYIQQQQVVEVVQPQVVEYIQPQVEYVQQARAVEYVQQPQVVETIAPAATFPATTTQYLSGALTGGIIGTPRATAVSGGYAGGIV